MLTDQDSWTVYSTDVTAYSGFDAPDPDIELYPNLTVEIPPFLLYGLLIGFILISILSIVNLIQGRKASQPVEGIEEPTAVPIAKGYRDYIEEERRRLRERRKALRESRER